MHQYDCCGVKWKPVWFRLNSLLRRTRNLAGVTNYHAVWHSVVWVSVCVSWSGQPSDLDGKLDCFSWIILHMSKHNLTAAVLDLRCHPWYQIARNEALILKHSLPRDQREKKFPGQMRSWPWILALDGSPSTDTEMSLLLSLCLTAHTDQLNSSQSLILFFLPLYLR